MTIHCPAPTENDALTGCGSANIVGPDDEGLYDCLDCGLWFKCKDAHGGILGEETTP